MAVDEKGVESELTMSLPGKAQFNSKTQCSSSHLAESKAKDLKICNVIIMTQLMDYASFILYIIYNYIYISIYFSLKY